MILEYVASGMSHTRIVLAKNKKNNYIVDAIRHFSKAIQGMNGHTYSVLFNAYTENKFEDCFKIYFDGTMDNVHTDSGGLQIVTLGRTITPELKKEIYKLQARASDLAMGFDEIPVEFKKDKAKYNVKQYNPTELINCARKTGLNVREQLQTFIDLDSRAKALPILQGNSVDSYKQWHKEMMTGVTSDEMKKVGGLSIGFSAFGKGMRESVDICKLMDELDTDISYFHLLGVGSIARLLPILILIHTGFFKDKIKRISYDSTSHTQNSSYGAYQFKNDKRISIPGRWDLHNGKCLSNEHISIWKDFSENVKEFNDYIKTNYNLDLCEETFYYISSKQKEFLPWSKSKNLNYEQAHKGLFTFMYFVSQMLNMTWTCNKLITSKKYLKEFILKNEPKLISLLEVKDTSDFNNWYKYFSEHLDTASFTNSKAMDMHDGF